VVGAFYDHVLKSVRERAVADVVEQDGDFDPQLFLFADGNAFASQFGDGVSHEVIGSEGVVQPGMDGSGVDQVCKCHLVYPAKSLVVRVRHDVQQQGMIQCYKAVNGVIYDLAR